MSETATRVRDHVRANPGVHFSAIVRDLDVATGQAQYHLRDLRRAGEVVREEVRGRTHYYSSGYTGWERTTIALLRRETARAIVAVLLDRGSVSPATLADDLDLARSTVEWHLSNLEDGEIVEKDRRDGRVAVELARPAAVRRLLVEVDPALADRVVDRFSRLVDHLLDG